MIIEQNAAPERPLGHPALADDWYRALELRERIETLASTREVCTLDAVDHERAERRLQRWRSQPPFTDEPLFARRLAADDISTEQLLYLLGEPAAMLQARIPEIPTWLTEILEIASHPSSGSFDDTGNHDFLAVVAPLIQGAREGLRRGAFEVAANGTEVPFDAETVADLLLSTLYSELSGIVSRTIVLELHVARLEGLLEGNTPEERFRSLLRRLQQPEVMQAFFQEYPVLARQLVRCVRRWMATGLEFLERLNADWTAIKAAFSLDRDPGVLTGVHSAGDRHRGGRHVLIATFSSGLKIVYKPRGLALDVHFQELLIWMNQRGGHPPFRTLRILDRGRYGWVEFIAAAPCSTEDELNRFYQRQGCYLALLYALESTDFHCENLIAAGEHPMLLDLEALFHPRLPVSAPDDPDRAAGQVLHDSVLRVGLLPQRIWSNAHSPGVDMSGLGAAPGRLTPFGVPSWEATGTDAMRLVRQQVTLPDSQNRPTLGDATADPLEYADAIAEGFTTMYRFLLEQRDELLADDGPLAPFVDDEVRVVLRATQTYATLLQESFHPDVLRDALDRTRLFDRLWVQAAYLPYLTRIIPAEQRDLERGDIPLFVTRPGSRDLFTAAGEHLPDFFEQPAVELVHQRLHRLSDADLRRQLWIIRASLAMLAPVDQFMVLRRTVTDKRQEATRERLIASARAIGDRLETLALRGDNSVSWIGLSMTDNLHWALAPIDLGLYDGLAGVALFLAYLGEITGEERYHALGRDATWTLRRRLERNQSVITSIGAFSGTGGLVYTLLHLASLWDDPSLLDPAHALLNTLPSVIEQDERLDLIGGATGCLAALLALHHSTEPRRALDLAIQCGDHLLARAQPAEGGRAWIVPAGGARPLTGFSHGAAGMAWALLRLSTATGEQRFRRAAIAALSFERSVFSPAAGNWPDLRYLPGFKPATEDNGDASMITWCHGAVGIGLARLDTLPLLDDARVRQEIDTALKTTLADGFGGNHSLCHGDLGNLELLLQAGRLLGDSRWQGEAERRMAEILASIEHDGWLCGNRLEVESPGLMTGLAGIGYGLLRCADPQRVPSVLLLEPPVRRRGELRQ